MKIKIEGDYDLTMIQTLKLGIDTIYESSYVNQLGQNFDPILIFSGLTQLPQETNMAANQICPELEDPVIAYWASFVNDAINDANNIQAGDDLKQTSCLILRCAKDSASKDETAAHICIEEDKQYAYDRYKGDPTNSND